MTKQHDTHTDMTREQVNSIHKVEQDNAVQRAAELIALSEGFRSEAYADPEKGGPKWTVGYGHTGPDVTPDKTVSPQEAWEQLQVDILSFADALGEAILIPLETCAQAALLSFVYNIGIGAFRKSTCAQLLEESQESDAAAQLMRWIYDDGVKMQGLCTRRRREWELWQQGDWTA